MNLKKLLISLSMVLLITGCNDNSVKLDLEKVEIELNNLETTKDNEKIKLFEQNKTLDKEAIVGRQIDVDLFDEILMSISTIVQDANMYIVYVPKEGKEDDCKKQIDNYLSVLEDNFNLYNPEEARLIKNHTTEKYGNYYIYVISEDNNLVIDKIKNIK